jgi:hypothetical protein
LIITEEQIADAAQRIERACEELARKHAQPITQGAAE